ncbi:AI-2E family transporter [Clostridium massiliamazoniense]|uniref:AI-2E family transporter n=1 Tax=Clostridium massiliamazoniense TaxID=1347366 RepID=UPI0006D7BAE7|nr:AI-2E family transporter [Clostridium massiliamazoniense]
MKILRGENIKYVKLFLVIVIAYVAIKIINNLPTELGWLSDVYHLLTPFIIALVISYILNPCVKFFNHKLKLPLKISIIITYLSFILIVALGAIYFLPKLYNSAINFLNAFPEIRNKSESILKMLHLNKYLDPSSSSFQLLAKQAFNGAISITTSIIEFAFGFLISIYVISSKDKFIDTTKKITLIVFGKKIGLEIIEFFRILNSNIGTYLGISAIDSLIVGVISFIGMTLLGVHYAILLAVVITAMNMIPYIGPYIAMIIAFLVCLATSDLSNAIITLIFLEVLHEFDSWFIQPKLIENKIGLNPAIIILAVTIGGAIYGPIGMIVATPIASVLLLYIKKILIKYKYRATGEKPNESENKYLS